MNSNLTVADARKQIGSLFATDDFINLLNQATLRILQSGRWRGSQVYADFPTVPLGYITLPYELESIMGVSMAGAPRMVFGNMHEFIISGPGHLDETRPATGILDFINDGFPVRVDPPTAGSILRLNLSVAGDVGKTFRFYGKNDQGLEIFDGTGTSGISVTTTGLTTDINQIFSQVTGVEVPVDSNGYSTMLSYWSLYSVAPDTTTTLLSFYYPNEARPAYARYKVGTWNVANDNDRLTIRTLCQRRFIPVYKETDWVIPGNIGALKAAMQAIQCEDANNYDQSKINWDYAMMCLNNEVHSARGAQKPELSIPQSLWGGYSYDGGLWGQNFWGSL